MSSNLDPRKRSVLHAAQEITDGMNVNLGTGLPTLSAEHAFDNRDVMLLSGNGLLEIGPYREMGTADADLINTGKETVTAVSGTSFFESAESFAMIRRGHVDLAMLGGMEVSESGDLVNRMIAGKMIKGMGGAMDLGQGAKRVIVLMEHCRRSGEPRVKRECTLPVTGARAVDRLITDLAIFDIVKPGATLLVELQPGVTVGDVSAATEARFTIADEFDQTRTASLACERAATEMGA